MAATQRFATIDFWRGLVLLTIVANHIPGNLVEMLSPRNFGFSDAAEAFIFISGVSVALVYGPRLPLRMVMRCLSRAFKLYRAHLFLTFAAVALFTLSALLSDVPDILAPEGRGTIVDDTMRGVAGILLLGHQIGYFNILPLYIILMLWAPIPLLLARLHTGLALTVALGIYGAARFFHLTLPSFPQPGAWYFNPLDWQLLFTIGIVAGLKWRDGPFARSPSLLAGSIVFLVLSLVVLKDAFGLAPGLWDWVRTHLDVAKEEQGLIRLLHFLALAYVLDQFCVAKFFGPTRFGAELERVGRHGLPIFAVGSILCALGQVLTTLVEVKHSASPGIVGLIYTLFAMGGLVLLARYLEWADTTSGRESGSGGFFFNRVWLPPFSSVRSSLPRVSP